MPRFLQDLSNSLALKLLVATTNQGKATEIESALVEMFEEIVSLSDFHSITPPVEIGRTFPDNARLKASYYRETTGLPALADDSGLMVEALGGSPGVKTARFAPSTKEGIAKILSGLNHLTTPDELQQRRACFECALCLDAGEYKIEAKGKVEGLILFAPAGGNGFGYDPIFYYPPLGKTFAQMTLAEKTCVSHRSQALTILKGKLHSHFAEKRTAITER